MRSEERDRPAWQLPPGVSRGTWDYVQSAPIATEYDTFHAGHPLLEFDRSLVLEVARRIAKERGAGVDRLVALDLGCGTGRTMLPLAEEGWRVLGVDLSESMLREVRSKSRLCGADRGEGVETARDAVQPIGSLGPIGTVCGNLGQLQFLESDRFDLAMCLYSSFGMVAGRSYREGMLRQVHRSLRVGGRIIVHVHNRGIWWRDPGGVVRSLRERWRSWTDRSWEYGDRVYSYRGLPTMYLHIFSGGELRRGLSESGFRIERWIPLNLYSSGPLLGRRFFSHYRAGGYVAIGEKVA